MSQSGLTVPIKTEAQAREERAMRDAQSRRPILDEQCEHTDLNAEKTRCLSCGQWLQEKQP